VKPGAKLVTTSGGFTNLLAFINPDKSIVVVLQNENEIQKTISIKVGNKIISVGLKADSFNTLLIPD
jgi:glucosylceramidase